MQDRNQWDFYLRELPNDYVALKFGEDGNAAVKLVVNKKFLAETESPLETVRLLEHIFKDFWKDSQKEE